MTLQLYQLQHQSTGILYEGYEGDYIVCTFTENGVDEKDELYIFRCSDDKECCGRECCFAGGFPLWLIILLLILLLLLLLLLLLYLYWRYCWRKTRTVKPRPYYAAAVHPPLAEKSSRSKRGDSVEHISYYPNFKPDAMTVTVIPEVEPTPYEVHHVGSDLGEQAPLISVTEKPESQKPKIIYYREGYDEVASY